ncbi:MAG: two-component system, OmpR family, phosphate regulon sensor histidine kinase PhoR [Chthoniobacter sp.]|jgi:signal transduction histidine kinase|nr:two-component system, OmpR family, phosphate regulon sensor histidine kinase PhoR [Chthoniobacter sp.]
MKKIALVFALAVLAPSLVLAWLALRSLRDQELVLERQQELLYQGATDRIAGQIRAWMSASQEEFAGHVEALTQDRNPRALAPVFDETIRGDWQLAEIGFCVTLDGSVLSPSLFGAPAGKQFRDENESFLSNRARAEVYQLPQSAALSQAGSRDAAKQRQQQSEWSMKKDHVGADSAPAPAAPLTTQSKNENKEAAETKARTLRKAQLDESLREQPAQNGQAGSQMTEQPEGVKSKMVARNVSPMKEPRAAETQLSNVVPSDAEFRQIVGDAVSGTVSRFLQNKLSVMFWHRPARDPQLIFGAQLALDQLKQKLAPQLATIEGIGLALLDDHGKPAARSPEFSAPNWKRPFVATEVGEVLPHWEVAAYLLDPEAMTRSAAMLRRVVAAMIAVMLAAICLGGWLLAADTRRQLALARQKTDFVSNVSHELKTPLTSIRMFSELLAEGRVETPEKQTQYSQIIAIEASRLTRLINNVLDFARLERGEKTYDRRVTRLEELIAETLALYRPQLEANGFRVTCETEPLHVEVDRDAMAQVFLNLLSNAEKYCGDAKEISITVRRRGERAELSVCDRGAGVPRGEEGKIFEQFHRAHDALNSGIQGAGLGLTLARELARAHGGDVAMTRREGGGSCFTVSLPLT